MKQAAIACLLMVVLAGCNSGGDAPDNTKLPPGTGVAANPSGKPTTPEEAKTADLRQQSGQSAGAQMAAAAQAEKEAKLRTGGK